MAINPFREREPFGEPGGGRPWLLRNADPPTDPHANVHPFPGRQMPGRHRPAGRNGDAGEPGGRRDRTRSAAETRDRLGRMAVPLLFAIMAVLAGVFVVASIGGRPMPNLPPSAAQPAPAPASATPEPAAAMTRPAGQASLPAAEMPRAPPDLQVPPAGAKLTAKEIAGLMALGEGMLHGGDIVSARGYFERAALAGDGEAALRLGESFDPAFLPPRLHSSGDIGSAIFWYRRGQELGNPMAAYLGRRLEIAARAHWNAARGHTRSRSEFP